MWINLICWRLLYIFMHVKNNVTVSLLCHEIQAISLYSSMHRQLLLGSTQQAGGYIGVGVFFPLEGFPCILHLAFRTIEAGGCTGRGVFFPLEGFPCILHLAFRTIVIKSFCYFSHSICIFFIAYNVLILCYNMSFKILLINLYFLHFVRLESWGILLPPVAIFSVNNWCFPFWKCNVLSHPLNILVKPLKFIQSLDFLPGSAQ